MSATYILRLYVMGETPHSQQIIGNLKDLLEQELSGLYTLEVVNILKNPQMAKTDNIRATPTLVRAFPLPIRRVIGNFSDPTKVMIGLELMKEENS